METYIPSSVTQFFKKIFQSLHLIEKPNQFSRFKNKNSFLFLIGRTITALWLILLLMFPFAILKDQIIGFLYLSYGLSISSFIFLVRVENFHGNWLEEKFSEKSTYSKKVFLLTTYFPLYLGPIWMLITPLVLKELFHSEKFYLSFLVVFLFIASWIFLQLLILNNISDKSLSKIESKLKSPRKPLDIFYFSLFMLVASCFIFYLITQFTTHFQELKNAPTEQEIYQYRFLFNNILISNGVFIGVIFLGVALRYFAYNLKKVLRHSLVILFVTSLVILHLTALANVFDNNSNNLHWLFNYLVQSSFLKSLPNNAQQIRTVISTQAILFPTLWIVCIFIWKGLQNRDPNLEVLFRLFFIPLSFIHLPMLVSPSLGIQNSWQLTLISLGAFGAFAFTFKSYIAGIFIYSTKIFKDGERINVLDQSVEGEVICINFMHTHLKQENGKIILMPNEIFFTSQIENLSSSKYLIDY